jgi:hypothetical protein
LVKSVRFNDVARSQPIRKSDRLLDAKARPKGASSLKKDALCTVHHYTSVEQENIMKEETKRFESILAHALNVDDEADSKTPATYAEAINGKESDRWQTSMLDEMASLESNDTWELVSLPPGCKAIGTKWEYKIKIDREGTPDRYKSRLVALGYRQKQGVDYQETFAPVGNIGSIRLLLALAASKGWDTRH